MPSYDVEAARKAGLSDIEIAQGLADRVGYDLEGARKAGIPDREIADGLVKLYNQSLPLSGEQQGQQPRQAGLRPTPAMVQRAEATAQSARDAIMLRDPGVDYQSGVKNFALRAGFSRMSNDAERQNYLNQQVGEGNFGMDRFGRYYIHPEGLARLGIQSDKPIALEEPGTTRYDIADVTGSAPGFIGATGGALAASGLGALPGMGLAALGAAGGAAYDELLKRAQGYNLKGPGEQATNLGAEALSGGLAEGLARGVIGTGRFMMNPYSRFTDPARQQLTRDALEAGMTPRVFQFQPGGGLLGRFQMMGEQVFSPVKGSSPIDRANQAAMEAGSNRLASEAGTEVPNVGERLIGRVKSYTTGLADQIKLARNKADSLLNDSLDTINKSLGTANPNVGLSVQEQIRASRKLFGRLSSELYNKVDELTGGQAVVPTDSVKSQLGDLLSSLPTDQAGNKIFPTGELKTFFAKYGNIADYQTVGQMQQLRTDFRNASESLNLVPGLDKYRARLMKNSVDQAFEDAMQAGEQRITTTSPLVDANGKQITTTQVITKPAQDAAITALRQADEFYKNGIKKFDSTTVASLTRDAGKAGTIEPDRVVDTIIRPGYSAAALRVKKLVSPETWAQVGRSHFNSLLADSTHLVDGAPVVNGAAVLKKISDMGKTFDIVYGIQAPAIRTYVSELAARDGKLDPSLLQGNIAANLQRAAAKQRELDDFLKNNYIASLGKPGQEATQAADFIFRPNSPERIAKAKAFYGENSKEFSGLQNEAMTKLLSDLVRPGEDPLTKIFDGKALRDTLDKYGRPTLDATFGKSTTDDLYKFATTAQFVTQQSSLKSSIVAPIVALHPLRYIWKIADLAGTSYLLRQPGAIRWLSEGITPGNKAAAAGAITRLGSLATALVSDKTSSGQMDLTRPKYQQ